jgi:hypothetical protein
MGMTACKSCGKEVASSAKICPSCGVSNPGIKRKDIIAGIVVIAMIAFGISQCTSSDQPEKQARTEESTKQPDLKQSDDPVLSNKQAAAAFSEYVGKIQAQIMVMSSTGILYMSKIAQDIQWGSLDKYREDAEALKEAAQKSEQAISEISYPLNVTDQQAEQFGAVYEASGNLAAEFFSMAADVAVNAHTGMNMNADLENDMRAFARAKRTFKDKVMASYKFFGYSPSQIDMETLQIKEPPATTNRR